MWGKQGKGQGGSTGRQEVGQWKGVDSSRKSKEVGQWKGVDSSRKSKQEAQQKKWKETGRIGGDMCSSLFQTWVPFQIIVPSILFPGPDQFKSAHCAVPLQIWEAPMSDQAGRSCPKVTLVLCEERCPMPVPCRPAVVPMGLCNQTHKAIDPSSDPLKRYWLKAATQTTGPLWALICFRTYWECRPLDSVGERHRGGRSRSQSRMLPSTVPLTSLHIPNRYMGRLKLKTVAHYHLN